MIYWSDKDENVLVQNAITRLIKEKGTASFDVHRYEGSNEKTFDLDGFVEDLNTPPFLSETKFIIIRDPYFLSKKITKDELGPLKAILDYIKSPLYELDVIFYSEVSSFVSDNRIMKAIKDNGKSLVPKSNTKDFNNVASNMIDEAHLDIDNKAKRLLIDNCNNSLSTLYKNLEKLKIYPEHIDTSVVEKLCDREIDTLIFNLTNAIFAKDLNKTIAIIRDFQTLNYSIFYIISVLMSQLRFYYELQYYDQKRYTMNEIVKITGAKEFRIRLAFDTLHRYQKTDFLAIINDLAELEQTLKSNSDIDDYHRFELFIIDLEGEHDASDKRYL